MDTTYENFTEAGAMLQVEVCQIKIDYLTRMKEELTVEINNMRRDLNRFKATISRRVERALRLDPLSQVYIQAVQELLVLHQTKELQERDLLIKVKTLQSYIQELEAVQKIYNINQKYLKMLIHPPNAPSEFDLI